MEPVEAKIHKEDSLEKRFAFKLTTNLFRIPLGAIVQAIVPRLLGPAAYGNFSFLVSIFNALISLLDTGTSIAFYTKLSARQGDRQLIAFYWRMVWAASALVLTSVGLIVTLDVSGVVWPGQEVATIWMGAVLALLTWYSQVSLKIVDAQGLTVQGEVVQIIQRAGAAAILALVFWQLANISLEAFFVYHYAMVICLCAGFWLVLRKNGREMFPRVSLTTEQTRGYVAEFWAYSGPLVVYSIASFFATVADRWLLQTFGGSVEQGFFSLSQKIAVLSMTFTTAMSPLLLRELSRTFEAGDRDEMRRLFSRYVPILYAVTAFVSLFFLAQSQTMTLLFGGVDYERARFAVAVMCFYPIYQTYGQLSASVFYAAGDTRLYRNIGTCALALGLLATYFLLAPAGWGGFGLNANGLAIKTVAVPIVAVNVRLWFNARFLGISFGRLLRDQVSTIVVLAAASWGVVAAVDSVVSSLIPALVVSAGIYAAVFAALVLRLPATFGVSRYDVDDAMNRVKKGLGWA